MTNPVFRIITLRTIQGCVLGLALHGFVGWPLLGHFALGLFLTPALCAYFLFVFVAPWSWGLPIRTRLRTSRKVAALTFDDGPSETTARALDILREFGAVGTFFVLGEAAARRPDLIRRIALEGHEIGVHAWRHESFVGLGRRRITDEIRKTQAAVQAACPEAPPVCWLRPPHGFKSLRAFGAARACGLRLVAWNIDSRDYRERDPARIAALVLKRLAPGAIVLLHDGTGAATAEALPSLLAGLNARGYRCVPLCWEEETA